MAELLARIYQGNDWKNDPNKPAERAAYYRQMLKHVLPADKEMQARHELAIYLLQAGNSAAAADEARKLREWLPNGGQDHDLIALQALASLRMGEQQNCLKNHNADSCVYPLRGGGIHQNRRGAEAAAELWTTLMKEGKATLIDKWLLNIAWMTLGGVPANAPASWKISPEQILPNEYDVGRFVDVAPQAGLMIGGHSGGSVAEDFDGDGYFDLVVSSSGPRDQLRYFHNDGNGQFTEQTAAAGLTGETGGLNVIHADYNNDGWPDILVLRGAWWGKYGNYPCSLLRNNGPDAHGQITFTDVTEEAGLLSAHPTQTAAWADYDGDGKLDLMLGHESNPAEDPFPSQLFHNNGNGTFTDVGAKVGLANLRYVKGVAWGDYNNDGRPDLYVSRKGAPNLLFRNDGPDPLHGWKFTDVTAHAGVAEPVQSFATWFFDYNNDGNLDLMVDGFYIDTLDDIPAFHLGLPNKAEVPRLYRNNGDGTFTDVTKAAGLNRVILAMGAGFGDLDNDGWPDIYFGTGVPDYEALLPNRMFRNDRGLRFQDVTRSGGFGQLQKGHAVSFADFNRDGNQDVFEVLGGAYPGDTYMSALLENPGHANHWIGLKLEGVRSNRSAIGTRVRVDIKENGKKRSVYGTVNSGTSFGDAPFELHFGIGSSTTVEQVHIRWPSGRTQSIKGLAADRVYKIREGEEGATALNIKPFQFPKILEPMAGHTM